MNSPHAQQFYHIAPELRRSAWYVFIGYFVCVVVTYYVVQRPGPFAWGPAVAGALAAFLAKSCVLRWRLAVDADGITRHRFLIAADYWSWEDFASGEILKIYPRKLVDLRRPGWRRTLNLDHLADKDADAVMQAINQHYQLPELVDLPETLTIRYGFRQQATFSWRAIDLQTRGQQRAYLWADVQRVRVLRLDPLRYDFEKLLLFLPHETLELVVTATGSGPALSWCGASAEVVSGFLRQHVPPDRWDEDLAGKRPAKRVDIEEEIAPIQKRLREIKFVAWGSGLGIGGLSVWTASHSPQLLYLFAFIVMIYGPIFSLIFLHEFRKRDELLRWLDEARQAESPESLHA